MTVTTRGVPDVDLFSGEVLPDLCPVYAELRERASVVRLESAGTPAGIWALTRYEPVRDALDDPRVFSSRSVAFNHRMNAALVGTSLATDPPDHRRLRGALTEDLSPRAIRGLKAGIDAKADAMVAELVERGAFDAIDDLARAPPRRSSWTSSASRGRPGRRSPAGDTPPSTCSAR